MFDEGRNKLRILQETLDLTSCRAERVAPPIELVDGGNSLSLQHAAAKPQAV